MTRLPVPVLAVAALLVAGAFSTCALSQDILSQKTISLDLAQNLAQAAVSQCRADGYRVSATVLDGEGLLKAFIRDDGAAIVSIDLSRRKAYTAIIFRRSSAETVKAFGALTPSPIVEGTVMLAGGVPIKAGSETIGAIGVSGAPGGDKDESCANAALKKFADKLI